MRVADLAKGALLVLIAVAQIAQASEPPKTAAPPGETPRNTDVEAKRLFLRGIELADRGVWAEALEAFRGSLGLAVRPRTVFNVGNALYRLGGRLETRVVTVHARAGWPTQQPSFGAGAGAPMLAQAAPPTGGFIPGSAASPRRNMAMAKSAVGRAAPMPPPPPASPAPAETQAPDLDEVVEVLGHQRADGLWAEHGRGDVADQKVPSSLAALRRIWDAGVDASHPTYGAQIKKAVESLQNLLPTLLSTNPKLAELVVAMLWLVGGRRVRLVMAKTARDTPAMADLAALMPDEAAVRARIR